MKNCGNCRLGVSAIGALLLTIGTQAWSADFTRFLSDPNFSVEQQGGRARIFPGGTDEKYFAIDPFGNRYKLRLKNALPMFSEIGFSILSEAAGLPTLPVHPTLVQRGRQGIPTSDAAKLLDPTSPKMGLAGARGEWFQATLQPLTELKVFEPSKLTGAQRAEFYGHLLLNGILGNNDLQLGNGKTGNVGFNGDHFVTLDSTQCFKFYPEEARAGHSTGRFLEQFDPSLLKSMNAAQSREFAETLNRVLTRFELLDPAEVERVFEPYFRATESFRKFKQMPDFDFKAELLHRLKQVRGEVTTHLSKHGFAAEALAALRQPAAVSAPKISIPRAALSAGNIPTASGAAPVELLWDHYFQDFWKPRAEAEAKWAAELGVEQGRVIETLLERAKKDSSRIHHVAPHMRPDLLNPASDVRAQTHLNPRNLETLFVVPMNDAEAVEIERIAREGGAKTMALGGGKYGHGVKLDEALSQQVIAEARRVGAKRVAIVEIPEAAHGPEAAIRGAGLELFTVDHHDYQGGISRAHPRSSLEQSAEILGHELSSSSKAIAVNDRAFFYGLRDLGVPRSSVEVLFPKGPEVEALLRTPAIETKAGNLYVLKNFNGPISGVASVFAAKDYPGMPNILMINEGPAGGMRFSGNPEVVEQLRALFQPHEARLGAHFSGGDPARSMFWGVNRVPEDLSGKLAEEVQRLTRSALGAAEAPVPCLKPKVAGRLSLFGGSR